MAKSLLQGKRFFCREWAFAKISHCLESRPTSKTCGALIMGGPGCGKTALCCETVWPRSSHGKQRALSKRVLAYHFCQAHDIETLSITNFIQSIVKQISESNLICGYEEKLKEPNIQSVLEYTECERDPDEAFKQAVLLPLLAVNAPQHTVFIVVDSIDESYLQVVGDRNTGSRTIAELLANHHQLFPQWLLLVCSARKQSKSVTRMFTGFRKISLDDLRKSHVVRDVQQYILCRLDQEELLRQHLSRDTAEMLNQLHIKSNGCFLYLEKVLDGVAENFIMLREIREIPGTLNGLYLWLSQRLFIRKQFAKIQPILNVILAARRPLTNSELYQCAWTRNTTLTQEEFGKRMDLLSKILIDGKDCTKILFHHSFAEWLLDVKHCTQKYLCNAAEGHGMLAMSYTLNATNLSPQDVQDFALHLSKTNLCPSLQPFHLPLWLIMSGAVTEDSLMHKIPKDQKVIKLLLDSGARVATTNDLGTSSAPGEREDSLRMLLDNGAMVNQVDANQRTLLHNAAYQGNLQIVNLLISRKAELEAVDKNGQTPLNLSARQGHLDVVTALLAASANVDHADNDGWTALRSAAWGGHTDVVGVLLNAGAQVDSADSDDRTALRAAAWGGHDDIVLKLLEHGAEVNKVDNEGRTALIAAAYMGHVEIVEHLLDHGAEINHEDADGRTALSVAALCIPASEGHAGVVSLLLDRSAEVDHKDKDGMTPLLVAAYEGHRDVCELLLESEADMDHSDNNGRTPLLAAASMGHAAVVNLLLFWGAAVDTIDSEGRTVLSIAAAQGNADVVRQLLDRGLDEMHRDNGGWTPLHYAAFEGHKEVCEALLESGARINEVDNDGKHPLILAAQEGHAAVVSCILNHGAMIDHRSHDGKTALRVAALEGHKDIVHLLLCSGSDINYKDADGRSTLYILALENKVQMAAFLLENGAEVEATDFEGRTPLHVSAWQGHYDIVELLLTHGAQVNAIDTDRRTALQSASWQGHTAVVQVLLERGAFVDHTCNQGATALCIAAQEGHEDVVRVLLKFNADPGHADQFGRNAVRVALKGGHMNVVKLLEEYGASVNGFSNIRQSSASVTSCSTTETKPSSAILTGFANGPHGNSPVDSPESALDKRRSYISNQSSSKSSSNLTSSSTNQSSAQPPTESSHGLSFTQQLQQCTRNRNRPISRVLSPLSEPQSPPQSPPGSPLSDVQSSRLSPVQNMFPQTFVPTPKLENFASTPSPQIITNPHLLEIVTNANNARTYGRSNIQPITIPSPNQTPEMPRKSSLPLSLQEAHFQNIIGCRSPDMKLRRNGIVTNPNYKGVNVNTPKVVVNPLEGGSIFVTNGNPTSPQLGYKQPLKTSYDGPARPNGLPIRKETPL